MRRQHIQQALNAALAISNHHEFVIAGSLSVLGLLDQPPEFMSMSIDIDFYPLRDPGRAGEIARELGEGSLFHQRNGFFLDPVSPELPTLPGNWRERLVEHVLGDVTALFLEVNDTAVSKYARGAENDYRWLETGYEHGILDIEVIASRMRFETYFYEVQEKSAALSRLRMHRVAMNPSGSLDHELLAFLHESHLEEAIIDLDLCEGTYVGEVLWLSPAFVVQSLGEHAIAVHHRNSGPDTLDIGQRVALQYLDGCLTWR